jgi:hypothetical protein
MFYPDANSTMRCTYGNVKSYDPKDGVHFKYLTTLSGVMEKEDPTNEEFIVPTKLKELYQNKDFGPYKDASGDVPLVLLPTTTSPGVILAHLSSTDLANSLEPLQRKLGGRGGDVPLIVSLNAPSVSTSAMCCSLSIRWPVPKT